MQGGVEWGGGVGSRNPVANLVANPVANLVANPVANLPCPEESHRGVCWGRRS